MRNHSGILALLLTLLMLGGCGHRTKTRSHPDPVKQPNVTRTASKQLDIDKIKACPVLYIHTSRIVEVSTVAATTNPVLRAHQAEAKLGDGSHCNMNITTNAGPSQFVIIVRTDHPTSITVDFVLFKDGNCNKVLDRVRRQVTFGPDGRRDFDVIVFPIGKRHLSVS